MSETRILADGKRYTVRNRISAKPQKPPCQHLGPYLGAEQAGCCGSVSIYACAVHGQCTAARCQSCPDRDQIPYPTVTTEAPDHPVNVTIGIPVRGQITLLEWVIKLHRQQRGVIPRFLLVDTGSSPEELQTIRDWATSPDITLVELGTLDQWQCPAEPVCAALQVIWDQCETRYLLQTHSDCLPANPLAVWDMLSRLTSLTLAAGYRMSERMAHPDWDWRQMLSHTFTAYDRAAVGPLNHNLADCALAVGGTTLEHYQQGGWHWWPDTECGYMHSLTAKGLTPGNGLALIGPERNHCLDKTPHYWHCRSLPSSALYAKGYHQQALQWQQECITQAQHWLETWGKKSPPRAATFGPDRGSGLRPISELPAQLPPESGP